jgi:hypothetical protein
MSVPSAVLGCAPQPLLPWFETTSGSHLISLAIAQVEPAVTTDSADTRWLLLAKHYPPLKTRMLE